MLRLRKSSFQAKRKQATHKATRCCLHTGWGPGREYRAHSPLPLQSCPRTSPQTKLHMQLRECGGHGVPLRTPSQAGHAAWDLNRQKTNREEAGTGAGASGGHVRRHTTGRWLPRRRARTRVSEPSGSTAWARPCAHGAAGSSPSCPRSSGPGGDRACKCAEARSGEESVTQPNSYDGDQAPQQGCGEDTGPTSGPGRGWAPGGGGDRGPGVMGCRRGWWAPGQPACCR